MKARADRAVAYRVKCAGADGAEQPCFEFR
jgi:hypothetical protein